MKFRGKNDKSWLKNVGHTGVMQQYDSVLNQPILAWVVHDTAAHFTKTGCSNALEDILFTTLDN